MLSPRKHRTSFRGVRPTMAARPKLQRLSELIESHPDGESWVFDMIADGMTMRAIAERMSEDLGFEFSRGLLYQWINHKPHKERRKKLVDEARKDSAERIAEDAGEILDDLSEKKSLSSADVQLGAQRSKYRQWLAGMRNSDYSPKSGVEVNLSIGELHLEALRNHSAAAVSAGEETPQLEAPDEEIVEAEFEVEESETEDELEDITDLI